MKLVSFAAAGRNSYGAVVGDGIVDLGRRDRAADTAAIAFRIDEAIPVNGMGLETSYQNTAGPVRCREYRRARVRDNAIEVFIFCHLHVKDRFGSLQNIELTNQMFTTDQFVLQSGFIKAPAIKNRIYMDTLGTDRTILETINDLSNSYVKKYGYDDFVLQCADQVLKHDERNIRAHMHTANYFNLLWMKVQRQYESLNIPKEEFRKDKEFVKIATTAIRYNKIIDDLGYAEMPPDLYSKWLNSLKNESMRQQHLDRKRLLTNMIEH